MRASLAVFMSSPAAAKAEAMSDSLRGGGSGGGTSSSESSESSEEAATRCREESSADVREFQMVHLNFFEGYQGVTVGGGLYPFQPLSHNFHQ